MCVIYTGPRQGCGGLIQATSGTIGSVDADSNGEYEPELDCTWQISVPTDQVVRLTFNTFALEGGDCDYDYVEVRTFFFDFSLSWALFVYHRVSYFVH